MFLTPFLIAKNTLIIKIDERKYDLFALVFDPLSQIGQNSPMDIRSLIEFFPFRHQQWNILPLHKLSESGDF